MIVNGYERDYIIHDDKNIKGFFGEYRWLSNYHVCDIYFEGNKYGSTEAAYQAAKSPDSFIRFQMTELSPGDSKQFAKTILIRNDWHNVKYDVMSTIVFDKFYRHKDLRIKLLETGDKYLEETNHWGDRYYGVCDGEGLNVLGNILMNIRSFWLNKERILQKKTKFFVLNNYYFDFFYIFSYPFIFN